MKLNRKLSDIQGICDR